MRQARELVEQHTQAKCTPDTVKLYNDLVLRYGKC